MPKHALPLAGLGRVPRHGAHIAPRGARGSGAIIDGATAEKAGCGKQEQEEEALSHVGKVADRHLLASVGISWQLPATSSRQSRIHDGTFAGSVPFPPPITKKTGGITPPV